MTFHPITANWLSPGFELILANEPELYAAYELPDYPGAMEGDGDWVDLYFDADGNDLVGRLWFAPGTNGCGIEELQNSNGDHLTRVALQLRDFHYHGMSPLEAFDYVKGQYCCGAVQTGSLADARARNQQS